MSAFEGKADTRPQPRNVCKMTQRGHRPHGVSLFPKCERDLREPQKRSPPHSDAPFGTRGALIDCFLLMSVRRNHGHDMETCSSGTRVRGHACEHARICAVLWTQPPPLQTQPLPLLLRWAALLLESFRAGRRHAQPLGSMESLM